MKFRFLFLAAVLIVSLTEFIEAQIILSPGDEVTISNYTAAGGENFSIGDALGFYDPNTKILKAESFGDAGLARVGIYYIFEISETPETLNNTVSVWIDYKVIWKGYQALFTLLDFGATTAKIELNIVDITTDGHFIRSDLVHERSSSPYGIDIFSGGLEIDDGKTTNNFAVLLRRGHTYRLKLSLEVNSYGVFAKADYYDGFVGGGDGKVQLTNLFIKVGLDDKETLALIASLKSRIDSLEYMLGNHYHNYLTGRGIGHNNTEANTTLSVFEEGNSNSSPPVYNDLLEENIANKSTPDKFSLDQNYPNPFNPNTKISFSIPKEELVTIKVFDVLGQQVKVLMNEVKNPGNYDVNFNAGKLPSGTYIYEIRAGSFVETKKMILLK